MATITMTKCTNIAKTFKVRKRRSGASHVQETPSTSNWLCARSPNKKTPNKTPKKDVFNNIQLESDNEIMWNYESPRRSESMKQLLYGNGDLGIDFLSTQDVKLVPTTDSQDTSKGRQTYSVWTNHRQGDCKLAGNADTQRCILQCNPVAEAGTAIADMYNILNNLKRNGSEDTKMSPNVVKKTPGFGLTGPTPGKTITRCKSDCTPSRDKQPSRSYWSDDEGDGFSFNEEYMKSIEIAHLANSTQQYSQTDNAPKNSVPDSGSSKVSGPTGNNRKCTIEDIKRKREAAIQKRKESLSKSQSMPSAIDAYKKAEIERKRLAAVQLRKQKLQRFAEQFPDDDGYS